MADTRVQDAVRENVNEIAPQVDGTVASAFIRAQARDEGLLWTHVLLVTRTPANGHHQDWVE
jgi:hypothetical protein